MEENIRAKYLDLLGITQWKKKAIKLPVQESWFAIHLIYCPDYACLLNLTKFAQEHWWLIIREKELLNNTNHKLLLNNLLRCCARRLGDIVEYNQATFSQNIDRLFLFDNEKIIANKTKKITNIFMLPSLKQLGELPLEKAKLWQRLLNLFDSE